MAIEANIMTTSGQVLAKAGDGVNANLTAGTIRAGDDFIIDIWIKAAEAIINSVCRYNWSDKYATLDQDTREILQDTASDIAAIKAITYDMNGYTTRTEAEGMINIYRDNKLFNLGILRDKKFQKFVSVPSSGTV